MDTYSIPSDFIGGFDLIIKLSQPEITQLSDMLSNLKIAESFDSVYSNFSNKIPTLSPKDFRDVFTALVSIVDIFESSNRNIEEFTNKFSKSFLLSKKNATKEESVTLKENLSVLLSNFNTIIITVKAQSLLLENQRNLRDTRIISDVRMVFDDNLDNKEKYALVVHNLKIEYRERGQPREFFVALDLSDLKKLKLVVDRAIDKDRIVRETENKLNFIDF